MTNGAAHARLRLGNSQAFRDPGRARIEQHRKSLRVIIVLAPSDVLAPLRTRAAMTARRFASDRADKSTFTELLRLFRQEAARARGEEKRDARGFQQHTKSLAPAFCKMPLQRWIPLLLVGRGSAEPRSGITGRLDRVSPYQINSPKLNSPTPSTSCEAVSRSDPRPLFSDGRRHPSPHR